MYKSRLEYKTISGDVQKNPLIRSGQRVIFDNATQEILVIMVHISGDFAQEIGVKLEDIDDV